MPSANHHRYSEVGILYASEITLPRFEVLYADERASTTVDDYLALMKKLHPDERLSHVPKVAVNIPAHHVMALRNYLHNLLLLLEREYRQHSTKLLATSDDHSGMMLLRSLIEEHC